MSQIDSSSQAVVDVRDCAQAHLNAIKVEAAANKRFILSHSTQPYSEYARHISEKYEPLGWPITKVHAAPDPSKEVKVLSNAASREVLGIEYHDFPTTMVEMADSMIALGSLKKPEAANL